MRLPGHKPGSYEMWVAQCQAWKKRYPVVQPGHRTITDGVSTYRLSEAISTALDEGDIVVSGSSGSAIELFLLAFQVKENQRVMHSRGLGAMGFGLPAAIGACLGSGRRRTVCVEGDGSFQMNAQELETVRRLDLPVKIFVINNSGYASIRSSQQNYFQHLVGADATSGLTLPDIKEVADAYGIPTRSITSQETSTSRSETPSRLPVRCYARSLPRRQNSESRGCRPSSDQTGAWSPGRWRICGHSSTVTSCART